MALIRSLHCERLASNEENLRLIDSFYISSKYHPHNETDAISKTFLQTTPQNNALLYNARYRIQHKDNDALIPKRFPVTAHPSHNARLNDCPKDESHQDTNE